MASEASSVVKVPRIAIAFCTQCKWNLRAAYYAQELLQTFGTSIGEIALIPSTGGLFTVTVTTTHADKTSLNGTTASAGSTEPLMQATETVVWDRKTEGGFPETKELKNRVRNIIEPGRDLGHIDRSLKKGSSQQAQAAEAGKLEPKPDANVNPDQQGTKEECEDCK
ncbi:selT/selW/selH selenoprotein domain-containing protein [Cladophialophora immunda]|nr:selT/selW/selH selenoprotein domain-containing protein [Cladophialophora immunda]